MGLLFLSNAAADAVYAERKLNSAKYIVFLHAIDGHRVTLVRKNINHKCAGKAHILPICRSVPPVVTDAAESSFRKAPTKWGCLSSLAENRRVGDSHSG